MRHLLERRGQGIRRGGPAERGYQGEHAACDQNGDPAGAREPATARVRPGPPPGTEPGPPNGELERRHGGLLTAKLTRRGRPCRRGEHDG
jgi:hypothetical protein